MARSSGASAPGAGANLRRSSLPGIWALSRHGDPASRAAERCLARLTRSATTALGSVKDRSLSSSARRTGRNSIFASTRSSSGPDSLARYRRRARGVQLQRCPGGPRAGARARVRRHDQRESGREARGDPGPGHHDLAGLKRLAKPVEHVAAELRCLVEKQAAVVRERCRARPDDATAAADDGRPGGRVVRRAKRRLDDQRAGPGGSVPATEWIALTSRAAAGSSLGRTSGSARRAWSCPRPAGRAASGDDRPLHRSRPPAWPAAARRGRPGPWARRRSPAPAAGRGTRLGPPHRRPPRRCPARTPAQRPRQAAACPAARRPSRSGWARRSPAARAPGPPRQRSPRQPPPRRNPRPRPPRRQGSTPGTGRTLPSRPSSPISTSPVQPAPGNRLSRSEDSDGNAQVEATAPLGQAGRGKADGDPAIGPRLAAVHDRRPDPVPGLAQGRVRQADEQQRDHAVLDVGLDLDRMPLHPNETRSHGRARGPSSPPRAHARS